MIQEAYLDPAAVAAPTRSPLPITGGATALVSLGLTALVAATVLNRRRPAR